MLRNVISVISIYAVLICTIFLLLRKVFEYIPIRNTIVFNKLYIKDLVCLTASFLLVWLFFTVQPPL